MISKIWIFFVIAIGAAQAQAQVRQPQALISPLAAAVERSAQSQLPATVVQSYSPAAAQQLLDSTAGPAWRVLQVQAPVCAKTKKTVVTQKNKKIRYNKKIAVKPRSNHVPGPTCHAHLLSAKKFSSKNRTEINNSALYVKATVLLTNAPKPGAAVMP